MLAEGEIYKLENEELREPPFHALVVPKPTGIRSFVGSGIGSKIGKIKNHLE